MKWLSPWCRASGSLAGSPARYSTYVVVSPPGSKATSAANKHTVVLASIAHNPSPADLAGTRQSIFSASATVFLLKQEQSSAGVQAGAFDLTDPNDSTQVAAAATGKIVEPHPCLAERGSSGGGYDRSVERDEDGERGGSAVRGKDGGVGVVVGEVTIYRLTHRRYLKC
ncbi:hypothetical protein FIBSPDRAFT_422791 [Athelia psychrophila]|uniref:Uncharacterized protein n=1 Tax=Athelia psychrophila TaxID=1759441 RepID=A0A166MWX8_9AGAM|nr:hypothetical protein FIBSPDRAFT_422791 [Fibularhizoctonia sp. CBS 109695]